MVKLLLGLYMLGVLLIVGFLADGTRTDWTEPEAVAPASSDEAFVRQAALNAVAQVEASRIAVERASSGDVRQFALHVLEVQQPLLEDLQQLATERGLDLPTPRDVGALAAIESESFDRDYLEQQIALHERLIETSASVASVGDADLRVYAWASATLAHQRLDRARALLAGSAK